MKQTTEKERDKEFKKLEKENERIRKEIKLYLFDLGLSERDINHINLKICDLIENEINQESLCNW